MGGDGIRTLVRILQGETVPRIDFIDAGLLLFENLNQWRHLVPPGS